MQRALPVCGSPAKKPKAKGNGTWTHLCLAWKGKSAVEEDEDEICAKSWRKSMWELGATPVFPTWLVETYKHFP